MITPHIIEGKKGPRAVIVPQPTSNTAACQVIARVGSRNEEERINGIAHALEHMVFKGTKKYPNPHIVTSTLDSVGAEFNAYTGKDITAFYAKVHPKHIEKACGVISQLACEPLLKASDWKREKNVILEEIKIYEENPMYKIEELSELAHYGDSKLGRFILGVPETVKAIEAKDIRAFWKEWYMNGDLTVLLSGNITIDQGKKLLAKYFPHNKSYVSDIAKLEEPVFMQDICVKEFTGEQVQIAFSWPAPEYRGIDYYAYKLLSAIMGAGMSSRLFMTVREKLGLAYSIRMMYEAMHDTGMLSIVGGVDANRVEVAVKAIVQELKKIMKTPVSADELKKVKNFIQGRLALKLDGHLEQANWYASQVMWGREPYSLEQELRGYIRVTADDIRRVANDAFSLAPSVAVVGSANHVKKAESYQKMFS